MTLGINDSIKALDVECCNTESHYGECHNLFISKLIVMLNVAMLNVVMLNVIAHVKGIQKLGLGFL